MGIFNRKVNIELQSVKNELSSIKKELANAPQGSRIGLGSAIVTDNMDLSNPFINDAQNSRVGWADFGETNLFPQILNDLYRTSPMHSACVNFKTWSIIGDGIEWKDYDQLLPKQKIELKEFIRTNNFKNASRDIIKNWVKHGRSIVVLHYDKSSRKYDSFKVVDPAEIRNDVATLFQDIKTYFYSSEWGYRANIVRFTPYSIDNEDEWQILEIKNYNGNRTYGLPDWLSSANWQSVSANLGLLHKSALENGIQPSVLFIYPYLMTDEEELQWTRGMQDNNKGVKNYNKAIKMEANGKENMPEVEIMKTTDNHKLFEQTSKEQKEEISISHNINPALMGVRIAGSLGASEEIEFSAKQFEKVWLNDNRDIIEDFLIEIASICGIDAKFKILKTELATFAEEEKFDAMEDKSNNKKL